MLKRENLKIEYNRQGYYGLLNGEPLLSAEQHVIYTPNADLIRVLFEEMCQVDKEKPNPEQKTLHRMISYAVDAYRTKSPNTSINDLLQKDSYIQLQSRITRQRSSQLFPIITDILEGHGLEYARSENLNRKHRRWIRNQIKGTDFWERSFLLEMGQKGFLILSLIFLNNHLTVPLYSEYCLLSKGLEPLEAREGYKQFITSHAKELTYLKVLYGDSD